LDIQPDSTDKTEILKPAVTGKFSPNGVMTIQGLDADIAQAERVKVEALRDGNLKIA